MPLRIDPVTATGGPLQPTVYKTCDGESGVATDAVLAVRVGARDSGDGEPLPGSCRTAAEDMPLVYKELVLGSLQQQQGQATCHEVGTAQLGSCTRSGTDGETPR